MRRAFSAAIACAIVVGAGSTARAAERGTIVGRVLNAGTGRPEAGVKVTLTGANVDGSNRQQRTVTTDERGRYRFARLATGEERLYTIDAIFQSGFFPSRA